MSEEAQRGLGEFAGGDTDDRPPAEAAHVAGGTEVTDAELLDPSRETLPESMGTVELAVMQVDYTIAGRGDDERPIVHVFGRTAEGELEHVQVVGFRPYFYAPTATVDEERLAGFDRITGWEETDEDGEPYESIRGEQLTKIFGQTPRDVGQIREEFDHYEADILFPNRFLIDTGVRSGIRVPERRAGDDVLIVPADEVEPVPLDAPPRVLTFDLEVDDRSGFPEEGEEPILCIASHDSFRDEYVLWIWESTAGTGTIPEDLDGYDPIEGEIDFEIRAFDAEEPMLETFLAYVEETDPDVMTGWNFDDFDAPYLIDRLEDRQGPHHEYDLDYGRLSRVGEVWRSNWGGPDIKGRVVFDLLYGYQRRIFTELDSYRLDAVGEQELGVGKERYPGKIGDLWEDDPTRLLEYNLRDVELCVELDRQGELIAFWREMATFVGCKLEDAPTPGDAVDMYVLHKASDRWALPSKGRQEGGEEYEGGAVFDPITGVRENVTVLDLKCFSGDTEVLTPDGPRNITKIAVGDPVYTLNPDTFECELTPVAETHEYENTFGRLHHLSGNTHDFKVTENHNFLVSKTRGWDSLGPDDFELLEYRDVPSSERFAFPNHEPMIGDKPETFDFYEDVSGGYIVVYSDADLRSFRHRMPADVESELELIHGSSAAVGIQKPIGKYLLPLATFKQHETTIRRHADDLFLKYEKRHRETPLTFEMTDWLEFLGWFVTEGSVDTANGRLTIHQSDGSDRDQICSLLDRMAINYNVDDRGVNVSNRYLLEWLEANCESGYANKRVPEWVFDLDAEYLTILLETMIAGDGSWASSGLGKYWTKSDHLMRAVSRLAVRCGHKPTISRQGDGTWYLSVGKRGSFEKSSNETVQPHDGNVYCITAAENNVVLAGRNGKFQWVGQSLYPMCMVTINASPETKVDPNAYDGETYVAPSGTHFRADVDGVMREMITELLAEREEKKARRDEYSPGSPEYEQYDRQQGAVKVIMNSLYGVSGWEQFRLYDKEAAAAITATGRAVIEFTETAANELDHRVAYGDTDSVMIELGGDASIDDALEQSVEIESYINGRYDDFSREELGADEHRFEIEFEKLYRRFFQAGTKKRYAGHIVWKEGKTVDDIDITGFEYQRSDIAPITKEVQHRVIEMIVREGDIDAVTTYVADVIDEFLTGDVELDRIGIPGGIGKRLNEYETDTAQVRGAKYANLLLGTNFQRGSKPKRVYLERVHDDFFQRIEAENGLDPSTNDIYEEFKRNQDVICFEYDDQIPDAFEVDYEKMLDKTLKGPIERILDALDVSWDEVKSGQEQTGLDSFV